MKEILPRILFMALWLSDILATILFVSVHGIEAEANPVMKWVISTLGLLGFALVKLIILAYWEFLARNIKWWINSILCVIMAYVVALGILTLFI